MRHPTLPTNMHTTRLWALALTLAVCSRLTTGCHRASLRPSKMMVADSISGFSDKQGANGWSYGYWDGTADADKKYSQKTDFQLLEDFGDDPIAQLSRRSDFATGALWMLRDGRYRTKLWAEGGSSNGTTELTDHARVDHSAVRRWVSTVNGPVTISGQMAKILPWGARDSGQMQIVVDGSTVFSAAVDPSSALDQPAPVYIGATSYSVNVMVHIGSLVDFLISPGKAGPAKTDGAYGPVKFTATIRAVSTLPR